MSLKVRLKDQTKCVVGGEFWAALAWVKTHKGAWFYGKTKTWRIPTVLDRFMDTAHPSFPITVIHSNAEKAPKSSLTKKFLPSHYQAEIFKDIASGTGHLVVRAVAGAGKTTTIVKALELTSSLDTVLFCAFNKHIRVALEKLAPRHVIVKTLHSLGYAILRSAFSNVKIKIDSGKTWGIIKEVVDELEHYEISHEVEGSKEFNYWKLRQPLSKLTSLTKATLTDPTDLVSLQELADYYAIELNGMADRVLPLVDIVMCTGATRTSVVDFDDMIWLPLKLDLNVTQYDWVFVDEAQDLNASQIELVLRSVTDVGRVVAVGDEFQSIYGFRGADANAIPNIIEALDAHTLPLSITYRCPKAVVELAQQLVPHIEAAPNAKEGTVTNASSADFLGGARDGDLVLCRINAPLVTNCYKLIRRGQKAIIRGRDIGKGLLALVDKLQPVEDIADLLERLEHYRNDKVIKINASGKTHKLEALYDKVETLEALCDTAKDLSELRYNITSIFDDDSQEGVIFSSVHRAKGDESAVVWILCPELMPHPLAKSKWAQKQEANIEYVAYTRSKDTLIFVETEKK